MEFPIYAGILSSGTLGFIVPKTPQDNAACEGFLGHVKIEMFITGHGTE